MEVVGETVKSALFRPSTLRPNCNVYTFTSSQKARLHLTSGLGRLGRSSQHLRLAACLDSPSTSPHVKDSRVLSGRADPRGHLRPPVGGWGLGPGPRPGAHAISSHPLASQGMLGPFRPLGLSIHWLALYPSLSNALPIGPARQATRARRCWSCQPPRGGVRGSVGTRVFLVSRADSFQSQS